MWNAWIVGLVGVWMFIAPFVSLSTRATTWNDWIFGVVAALVGFSMSADNVWQRPLAGLVGVWLFISGFIAALHVGGGLQSNDIVVGILLVIACFGAMTHHPHHAGHAPMQGAH